MTTVKIAEQTRRCDSCFKIDGMYAAGASVYCKGCAKALKDVTLERLIVTDPETQLPCANELTSIAVVAMRKGARIVACPRCERQVVEPPKASGERKCRACGESYVLKQLF